MTLAAYLGQRAFSSSVSAFQSEHFLCVLIDIDEQGRFEATALIKTR